MIEITILWGHQRSAITEHERCNTRSTLKWGKYDEYVDSGFYYTDEANNVKY